jgi:hypothetical protein
MISAPVAVSKTDTTNVVSAETESKPVADSEMSDE